MDKNHDFTAYTNINDGYAGYNWTRVNLINALIDPDTGLCRLFDATLVRDNWDLYILKNPGVNRGVTVEYAKNMTGIEYRESMDEVATRIVPIGEKENGKPLLLSDDGTADYIDSPRIVFENGTPIPIADAYPFKYIMELQCENCKVGSGGLETVAQARARMRQQVDALFEKDIDLPRIEMSVDFINIGDTQEYRQFRNLERLFLGDYVMVRHKLHGIDVTAKIVSIEWDCLAERMIRMEVGNPFKTLANSGFSLADLRATTKQYLQGNDIFDSIDKGNGIGIKSVEQTITSTDDNGVNVIAVTLTDDTVSTFTVENGSKGSPGVGIVDIYIREV
jgi:phage minor structural protein